MKKIQFISSGGVGIDLNGMTISTPKSNATSMKTGIYFPKIKALDVSVVITTYSNSTRDTTDRNFICYQDEKETQFMTQRILSSDGERNTTFTINDGRIMNCLIPDDIDYNYQGISQITITFNKIRMLK